MKFEEQKEIIIIKPEVSSIVQEVERLYQDPKRMIEVAQNGKKKAMTIYGKENQIAPRIKLIRKVAKQYYGY